ncbi:MAG: hypothetical protein WBP41_07340 [Saprospiraceae bacterium]
MKIRNIIIKAFCLVTFIFTCMTFYAQDRPVAWVHGLGEDETTWDIYDNLFHMERQMIGSSRDYSTSFGVASFATAVSSEILSVFPNTSGPATQNIGIGHSLGGLAIRELDRTRTESNRRLGGLITIGTPNDGATIVTSIRNGDVTRASQDACERLAAGPLSEVPFVGVIVQSISNDVLCDMLANDVLDGLFQDQATGLSINDVVIGSDLLTKLNSNPPNIPAISIRGNENSPVHWRILSSFDTDNEDDQKFVEIAGLMRSIYNGFYTYHLSRSIVTGILGFFNPLLWIKTVHNAWQATQWHRGKKWFDQSESIWNGLIGCTGDEQEVTVTQITGVDCDCFGYTASPAWLECLNELCNGNINECWHTVTYTTNIIVNNSSDGLFCDQTQLIDGLPPDNYYEAKGVNHSEETNTTHGTTDDGSDVVKITFGEIWERIDVFGIPTR